MDGIESRAKVIVIAATNRLDIIDSALLRPGRFDRLIKVPLPNVEARSMILKIGFNGRYTLQLWSGYMYLGLGVLILDAKSFHDGKDLVHSLHNISEYKFLVVHEFVARVAVLVDDFHLLYKCTFPRFSGTWIWKTKYNRNWCILRYCRSSLCMVKYRKRQRWNWRCFLSFSIW